MELTRKRRKIRENGKHDRGTHHGEQYTYWFETAGTDRLAGPPLIHHSCGLKRGDIFFHKLPDGWQLWLRNGDESAVEDVWTEVDIGYIREDGRKLTVTPTIQAPSWVGGDWGTKKVRELTGEYRMLRMLILSYHSN